MEDNDRNEKERDVLSTSKTGLNSDDNSNDNNINADNVSNDCHSVPPMSKKQMKKLLKQKKWLEARPEKRRLEKERKKLKLKKLKEEGTVIEGRAHRKSQLIPMADSTCKVCLCIDCHFNEYMIENDMKKLVKQIGRCYAVNRHSARPVQLYVTSITGAVRDVFLRCQPGFTNWDAVCTDRHWTEVFADKSKIIYLSSDSQDLIPEPKQICGANDNVFIIGGLVDHNRHKGLCHRLAGERSVRTGRLPIDECIEMSQRRVLAVNHVFEIMVMASNGSSDSWPDILKQVIPLRKLKQ